MRLERRLLAVVATELIVGGLGLTVSAVAAPRYLQPPIPHTQWAHTRSDGHSPAILRGARARSAPVTISIPTLRIFSPLGPARGLNRSGTMDDAPLSGPIWSLPWWYDRGPSPGQPGSAVLLGHVDSAAGTGHLGVFFRLGDMAPGDRIDVQLADGVLSRWIAVSAVVYNDYQFPDSLVFGRTGSPVLRLVTCGGQFDWRTGHYESTLVVTAVETA